jgi:hypothetical protein
VTLPQIIAISKGGTASGSQTARDFSHQRKLEQRMKLQKLQQGDAVNEETVSHLREVHPQHLLLEVSPQEHKEASLPSAAPHPWPQRPHRQSATHAAHHPHGAEPASFLVDRVREQLERSYGSLASAWETISAGAGKLPSEQLCRGHIQAGVVPDDAAIFIQAIIESSAKNDPLHGKPGFVPRSEVSLEDFLAAFRPGGMSQIIVDAVRLPCIEVASWEKGDNPNIRLQAGMQRGGISHRDPRTILLSH